MGDNIPFDLMKALEDSLFCLSRGPRIGSEGVPYCKRVVGHDGPHRPGPADGWGSVEWGKPDLREPNALND